MGEKLRPSALPARVLARIARTSRGRALARRLFHHAVFEDKESWAESKWLGVRVLKTPQDLWTYQEIITETRPDLIVETGTFKGGSALFLATICDGVGNGRVVSVDINRGHGSSLPAHPRFLFLEGSSTDPQTVERIRAEIATGSRVMAILDSAHSQDHVIAELRAYGPLVTPGCYLVVEDTNLNGHPVAPAYGPGPMEAVREFLAEGAPFEVDRSRERFLVTFHPGGFLRRVESLP